MKLVYQINLAFAISLILVLSVTGAVIHFVLMDHFIGAQKEDLKTMGAAMTAKLGVAAISGVQNGASETSPSPGQTQDSAGPTLAPADEDGSLRISVSSFEVTGNVSSTGVPMSLSIPYSEVKAILTDKEGNVVTANLWEESAVPLTPAVGISPSTLIPPL